MTCLEGNQTMGHLDGRVAVITGAGRGIGREHALLFAAEGAKLVVNDPGGAADGTSADLSVAQQVADEITAAGGDAAVNTDSVSSWAGAKRIVDTAIETFGRLDVLVNNAGILRDRRLVNMTEEEFDAVIDVHLKGTFCTTRHAAAYWRAQAKAGEPVHASVINTSSPAGLFNNVGQANYGAAKTAIATFSMIAAKELRAYGVRVNTICPVARTRLTLQTPGLEDLLAPPEGADAFDSFDPANISPLVAYLATEECKFSGTIFHVHGGNVGVFAGWPLLGMISSEQRWTVGELERDAKTLLAAAPEKDGFLLSELDAPDVGLPADGEAA
jgi:NAD(P)-dependent dehydrogenase (short-subunit alcohol dehydrogenase family)